MIGRKEEIQELTDLYDSKEAQFVAIYGRSRVGKTYLVNETFQGKFTFRHAGLSPSNELKVGMLKAQLNYSTLITTYGLKQNEYRDAFLSVVTIDDLFA